MGGRPLPRAVVSKITELSSQNMSVCEIAKRTGASYNGVRRHIDPNYREKANHFARQAYRGPKPHEPKPEPSHPISHPHPMCRSDDSYSDD